MSTTSNYYIEKIGVEDEFWVSRRGGGIVHLFNRKHGLIFVKYHGEILTSIKNCGHLCGSRRYVETCCQCEYMNHHDFYCNICVERWVEGLA